MQGSTAEKLVGKLGAITVSAPAASRAVLSGLSRMTDDDVGSIGPAPFASFVGSSPAMRRVYDLLAKVGPTEVPVLLVGESGTGKELAARTLHDLSPRRDAPFLAVNAGAIPSTMVESEMFGHERGSFTGAFQKHVGYFERAQGGTLLLDEITEMPIDLQVKLLRVLESDSMQRIGGERDIQVDVRIIAATNSDPEVAIAEGRLRKDLFYRLGVFRIDLPPLRERGADLELLAKHFLDRLNAHTDRPKRLADDALAAVDGHMWPGNVRELRNLVTASFLLSEGEWVRLRGFETGRDRGTEGRSELPSMSGADASSALTIPVGTTAEEAEKRLILATLTACDGNKNEAARVLGLSLKTVYNRLKAYRTMSNGAAARLNGSAASYDG